MKTFKRQFKESYANITINQDFNELQDKIVFKTDFKEPKKKTNLPTILSISFSLVLIVAFTVLIITKDQKISPKYQDFINYQVSFNSKDEAIIEDDHININLPMMYNAYDLSEEIDANTKWDVYKDGIKQDKANLALSLGENNFNVVVYKLDKVERSYKLNINVGK